MRLWRMIAFGLVLTVGSAIEPAPARAYDMDCKVILCLAGGFPNGCGDAHSYMMSRLKKKKPPFGPCSNEGPGDQEYDGAQATTGVDEWVECPGGYLTRMERETGEVTYCVGGLKHYAQSYVHVRIQQDDGEWYDPGHYRYGARWLRDPYRGGGDAGDK